MCVSRSEQLMKVLDKERRRSRLMKSTTQEKEQKVGWTGCVKNEERGKVGAKDNDRESEKEE